MVAGIPEIAATEPEVNSVDQVHIGAKVSFSNGTNGTNGSGSRNGSSSGSQNGGANGSQNGGGSQNLGSKVSQNGSQIGSPSRLPKSEVVAKKSVHLMGTPGKPTKQTNKSSELVGYWKIGQNCLPSLTPLFVQ